MFLLAVVEHCLWYLLEAFHARFIISAPFLGGYDFFQIYPISGSFKIQCDLKKNLFSSVAFSTCFSVTVHILFNLEIMARAQRPRELFSGCYVFAQAVTYLLWLHRVSQLVKGFVHEHKDNVAPSWKLVLGRGRPAVATNGPMHSTSISTCRYLIERDAKVCVCVWGGGQPPHYGLLVNVTSKETSRVITWKVSG